jgi:hypothetical protein
MLKLQRLLVGFARYSHKDIVSKRIFIAVGVFLNGRFSLQTEAGNSCLYLKHRKKLEEVDATMLESFASKVLEIIGREERRLKSSHDLEVMKKSIKHLKNDASTLKGLEPGSDDYDFSRNDCKTFINSVKRRLTIEGLLS